MEERAFQPMCEERLDAIVERLVRCDRDINPWRWRLYDIAEAAAPLYDSIGDAVQAVTADLPQIRAAQEWAYERGHDRTCWILADGLAGYVGQAKPWDVAIAMYRRGIEAARRGGDVNAEAAVLFEGTGHVMGRGSVAEALSATYRLMPDPDLAAAERECRVAAAAFEEASAHCGLQIVARRLGMIQVETGRVEEGLATLSGAIAALDEMGDHRLAARARLEYAEALIHRAGRPADALPEMGAAVDVFTATGGFWDLARAHELRALAMVELGQRDRAQPEWAAAHQGFLDTNDADAADRVRREMIV